MITLTNMLDIVKSNIEEDEPLIKPSELFNVRVSK
jgi:hypothetical protein